MRDVYIVTGYRTPFMKAKGFRNPLSASDLAVVAAKQIFANQPILPTDIDEVIVGCVAPSADETNIGRVIALRMGCGKKVCGWTVQRNCASGLQAIDSAFKDIAIGRHDLVVAGGTEAMSRTPLLWSDKMVDWLASLRMSKSFAKKIKTLAQLRPQFFAPVIALLKGLTDPVVGLNMGQTAEILAYQFGISREVMDEFAVSSHRRAALAYEQQHMAGLTPVFDWKGGFEDSDNGIRTDSSVVKLAKLKPVFDKPFGHVTAGNSSQVTDGAAMLLLASKDAVERYGLTPVAKIRDIAWSALDPSIMGLGPAHAIAQLLQNNELSLADIDFVEINEAFAAQVLACQKALADADYCKKELGWSQAVGRLDMERLNVDGGAIALGHPVGASGARVTLQLMNILARQNAQLGIASLCIGGGQGGAVLLETVENVA